MDVIKAFVSNDTSIRDRLYCAVKSVIFVRFWKQFLAKRNYSNDFFITQNAWECLEIDLVLLVSLALKSKAENITELCSQKCEQFFRHLRSMTGMESTIVNVTMKSFTSRAYKIAFEESVMKKMHNEIVFPKLIQREKIETKSKEFISKEEIYKISINAKNDAILKLEGLGIECKDLDLTAFLKSPKTTISLNNADSIKDNDYLQMENEAIFQGDLQTDGMDDLTHEIEVGNQEKIKYLKIIQNNVAKVSSDITHRFKTKRLKSSNLEKKQKISYTDTTITKGEKIIMKVDKEFIFGTVLAFRYLHETTKSKMTYYGDSVDRLDSSFKNIGILLEPAYVIKKNQLELKNFFHDFIKIQNYTLHIKNDCNVAKIDLYTLVKKKA